MSVILRAFWSPQKKAVHELSDELTKRLEGSEGFSERNKQLKIKTRIERLSRIVMDQGYQEKGKKIVPTSFLQRNIGEQRVRFTNTIEVDDESHTSSFQEFRLNDRKQLAGVLSQFVFDQSEKIKNLAKSIFQQTDVEKEDSLSSLAPDMRVIIEYILNSQDAPATPPLGDTDRLDRRIAAMEIGLRTTEGELSQIISEQKTDDGFNKTRWI